MSVYCCTSQLEAEAAGRQDALRRAAAALQEAEGKARLAVALRRELDEVMETAAHLEAELVAAQVCCRTACSRLPRCRVATRRPGLSSETVPAHLDDTWTLSPFSQGP